MDRKAFAGREIVTVKIVRRKRCLVRTGFDRISITCLLARWVMNLHVYLSILVTAVATNANMVLLAKEKERGVYINI